MFNYKELEKIVFCDENKKYSELTIITGYITPRYVEKIYNAFGGKISIYIGMGDSKYKSNVYNTLKTIQKSLKGDRTKIYYTNFDVHAKIYIWKNETENRAYIGSANFSESLMIDYKEVLGTYDVDEDLNKYCEYIISNSTELNMVPKDKIKSSNFKESKHKHTEPVLIGDKGALLSFLSSKKGTKNILGVAAKKNGVHCASGLNWGLSNGASGLNDGCIPIPTELIKNDKSMLRIPKSSKRVFKGIWDDGTEMEIQFEGNNNVGGEKYPKQIASHPDKNIMGKYLRKRIGDKINKKLIIPESINKKMIRKMTPKEKKEFRDTYQISLDDLRKYGRYDIEVTDMGDETYYFDFSVID